MVFREIIAVFYEIPNTCRDILTLLQDVVLLTLTSYRFILVGHILLI